jgi:hypothetical protein
MMQPGSPQALMPPDESTLMRRVQDLERQVRELVAHDVLRAAGVETETDLIRIIGSLIVTGDLSVPNGSIDNAALANPVTAGVAAPGWANGWSGGASWADKAATSIAVPAGFSQALVIAVASVTTTGSLIRYDIRARIGGSVGVELQNLVDGTDSSSVAHTAHLTGLAGGAITLAAQVYTAPNLAAHSGNIAAITGCAIFLR